MSELLKATAKAAGLSAAQQQVVDALSKSLTVHEDLSRLPADVAQQQFKKLTPAQQDWQKQMYGTDEVPVANRSILGSAAHYAGVALSQTVGRVFGAMNYLSDTVTRGYRTAAIARDQNKSLTEAWNIADKDGNHVFAPDRIASATVKYGADRMAVAQRVAAGEKLSKIQATAENENQAKIAAMASQKQDNLFQDAVDAANAAKYSPGRAVANALLPEWLEGSGPLYKIISGFTDANFRIFTDPTLAVGKLYKGMQVAKYGLDALKLSVAKGSTVELDAVFARPEVRSLWNTIGGQLKILDEAKSADKPLGMARQAAEARQVLERLVPEIPTTAWDEFAKAGVTNADGMKNYLANNLDAFNILSGQSVRYKPLLPAMTPGRAIRIKAMTTGNKVIKWSEVKNDALDNIFASADDIFEQGDLNDTFAAISELSTKKNLAATRFSTARVKYNIDKAAAKFTRMPFMDNQKFKVNGPNAPKEVYRLARLQLPTQTSRMIAEVFDSSTEGRRIEIYKALIRSLANSKNTTKSKWAKDMLDDSLDTVAKYAEDDTVIRIGGEVVKEAHNPALFADGIERGVLPYQFTDELYTPDVRTLEDIATKDAVTGTILGWSNHEAIRGFTSFWNLFTIGGPRMPFRSGLEDYGVHLLVGEKSWNLPQARAMTTLIRTSREDSVLGFINKIVKKSEVGKYQGEIEAIRANKELGDAARKQAIDMLAYRAIIESKTGKLMDDIDRDIWERQFKYGNVNHVLDSVTESATNAYTGTDKASRAVRIGKNSNATVAEVVIKGKGKVRRTSRAFETLHPADNWENRVSWIEMINKATLDQVGRLVVGHLEDSKMGLARAKFAIKDYFTTAEGKAILNRYRSFNNLDGVDEDEIADRAIAKVWSLFSKADGSLNEDLLRVVRPGGPGSFKFNLDNLDLDSLPKLAADMPKSIVGPKYTLVGDTQNWLRNFMDWSWWKMSQANGMISREPIAIDTLGQIRRNWKKMGYDDAIIDFHTRGITDPIKREIAREEAERRLAAEAEERAINYTLAYVDNPNIQSQLAFVSKNLARYFRATEDFYRRITRAVRYNPESLAKAALTYEGIAHSGFVQTDDQGEKYFVFPGLEPVYRAVQGGLAALGFGTSFKIPLPVEFRAKLSMVTPSINPESMIPTFSGPAAAIPVNVLTRAIGSFNPELGADITRLTMGAYSVDQPLVSAILPAHINRIYATLNRDDRDSQYASAQRKAMTYLAAAGKIPQPKINPETGVEEPPSAAEVRDFREQLRNATLSILGMRVMLGFVGPATPTVDLKSDMAKWVRQNGEQSFKTAFWNLRNETGSYEKAMEIWVQKYPNQIPFTVSESDGDVKGLISAIKPVGDWLDKYGDVYNKYPKGAAFLVPQAGGPMSYDVYRTLQNNGITFKKNVGDFYRDISTAADMRLWYANRDNYEQQLSNAFDDFTKQQLKSAWDEWSKPWLAARPDVQAELSQGGERQVARRKMLQDLRDLLADKTVKASPKAQAALRQMVGLYDEYMAQKGSANAFPGFAGGLNDVVKAGIKQQMEEIAATNANASAAYDRLFRPLIGD